MGRRKDGRPTDGRLDHLVFGSLSSTPLCRAEEGGTYSSPHCYVPQNDAYFSHLNCGINVVPRGPSAKDFGPKSFPAARIRTPETRSPTLENRRRKRCSGPSFHSSGTCRSVGRWLGSPLHCFLPSMFDRFSRVSHPTHPLRRLCARWGPSGLVDRKKTPPACTVVSGYCDAVGTRQNCHNKPLY